MVHCGGVCGDSCRLECHDVNDCSSACGDNCTIDCHNTVSCGAFCGANCQYTCESVDRCGVRAGPGSMITCNSVTTCVVECLGACRLSCNDANPCELTCLGGGSPDLVHERPHGVWIMLRRSGWDRARRGGAPSRRGSARASDAIIRYGRVPIGYAVEVEPHLVLGSAPPGPGYGSGAGIGVRASFVVAPEGFIRGVNDSAAIGFGLDLGHYYGSLAFNGYRDQCVHFEPGPNGTSICTERHVERRHVQLPLRPGRPAVELLVHRSPVGLRRARGQPVLPRRPRVRVGGAFYVGGRLRVADRITITARIGYPTVGIGVSFMM